MLKIALVVLFAKIGVGLFAFGHLDGPLIGLAQFAYLTLLVGFFYLALVGISERVLGWLEPDTSHQPHHLRVDDDRIDAEWLENVLKSGRQNSA